MSAAPETFLIMLAICMCSILFIFTIAVVIIFHCCRVKDIQNLPHAVIRRTRLSYNWARNSVFSHRDDTEMGCTASQQQFLSQDIRAKTPTML